jgi:hypothetical protein
MRAAQHSAEPNRFVRDGGLIEWHLADGERLHRRRQSRPSSACSIPVPKQPRKRAVRSHRNTRVKSARSHRPDPLGIGSADNHELLPVLAFPYAAAYLRLAYGHDAPRLEPADQG